MISSVRSVGIYALIPLFSFFCTVYIKLVLQLHNILALPCPALPGQPLSSLGLGELVAPGTRDLCAMHLAYCWHCVAGTGLRILTKRMVYVKQTRTVVRVRSKLQRSGKQST